MTLLESVRVVLGLGLPWLTGVLWVALAVSPSTPGRWASAVGFGFPIGMLLVIAFILGQRALGWEHQWPLTLGLIGFAGIAALLCLLLIRSRGGDPVPAQTKGLVEWKGRSYFANGVVIGLCALILLKLVLILQEIWLRPLFPWDAWNFHAQQARIWAEHGILVEFTRSWWEGMAGDGELFYVQFAFNLHPPGLSLIQFWMVESLSRYDDAQMNLPWFALAISLCLATYGQVRMHGGGQVAALLASYGLISLPMVYTHLALAGYADIWMGAYLLLAASFLCVWISKPRFGAAVLCLLGISGMLLMKQSGLFWVPIVLTGLMFGLFGWRWAVAIGLAGLVVLSGFQFLTETDLVGQFTSRRLAEAPQEFATVAAALWQNLFLDANWHLLWYMAPFVLVLSLVLPEMRSRPRLSMTVMIVIGLLALFYAFFFTRAGEWVVSGTSVNRVILHLIPLIVLWFGLVANTLFDALDSRRRAGSEVEARNDRDGESNGA